MSFSTKICFWQSPSCLLLLLFFALTTAVKTQVVYPINASDSISTCSGIFTDNGGVDGDHSVNGSDTLTICSNSSATNASHIRLTFTEFIISGSFQVYNGPTTDPALLVNTLDEASNNTNPVLEASASNASGCLTLVYTAAGEAPGWQALISCVRACQPVIATLASSDPAVMPIDTGYIDVCIGETIDFAGAGLYPESGFIYEQSDENSTFSWSFADGTAADGVNASHAYNQAGGYTVQLTITDQNGCSNNNQISQRIRVAPRPNFTPQTDIPTVVCAGDTLNLTASTQFSPNPSSHLFISTPELSFAARQILADTTFLPDGTGVEYTTSLEFNNFAPGQVVSSAADVEAICLNMEHSYAGDLDIWLECPSGQEVYMVRFNSGLFGQFVGEPIDLDDLQQGVGYDYCWTSAANQTWPEAVASIPVFSGQSIPAGDYRPEDPLSNFIGCPLNGEWTIHVRDNLGIDNGWIFSWGVSFADYLFPDLERFTVDFTEAAWRPSDDLLFYSADSITAAPAAAGQASYVYSVTDAFGCVNDTTLMLEVLPFSHPDCYDCQPMLDNTGQVVNTTPGTITQTNLASQTSLDTTIVFKANPAVPFGNALYPSLGGAYRNTLRVNSIAPATITDISQLESICVNINTLNAGGIRLFVMPPNGAFFELSTANGGTGSNYTNTCFSPSATTPITAGTPPFTGDFLPEGNLNNLIGTPINGNWMLLVYHVGIGTPLGEVLDWSITFKHENPLTYTWSPNDDGNLSCTDCPAPTVTAGMTNTAYQLVVSDAYGCSETANLIVNTEVTLELAFDVTDVDCAGADNGSITVSASNGTEPYSFAWSTGDTTATINGLSPGTYSVIVTDANGNSIGGSATVTEPAALVISLDSQTNVACAGDMSGELSVAISGGTAPYVLAWSNDADSTTISNLSGGVYTLSVTDANGCESQQSFTIEEPPVLEAALSVVDIACGDSGETGSIDLMVGGGTSPYTFVWSNGAETEDLTDLAAGDYSVVITDANACTIELSASVVQSSAIVLTAVVGNVACAGDNSGAIDLSIEGGTAPFSILWSNGATTEDLDSLAADTYTVELTDSLGCTASLTVEVTQSESLVVEALLTNLSCNGDGSGAIDLSVSGGTGSYTFLWSDGSTEEDRDSLLAAVYSVVITDENGCSLEESFTITEPDALDITFAVIDAACAGEASGSIDLTVSGGTPPASFLWSNGATTEDLEGLTAGTYTVSVTDINGCTTSGSAEVGEAPTLLLNALVTDLSCNGDSSGAVVLGVSGGVAPYTYLWSNGSTEADLTAVAAGIYSVVVTDANSCTASLTDIVVSEPSLLSCEVTITQEAINNNDGALSASISGGTAPYELSWSNGATVADLNNLEPGTYVLTVTDANGCVTSCTATLRAYAGVGDYVFFDMNRDGIQNIGEGGIAGVTVLIMSTDGSFMQMQQTDALGRYLFRVLPGDYWINFSRPPGLQASPQNQGGDEALDSDIDPNSSTTAVITLVAFEENLDIDAGFFDPCNPGLTGAGTIGFSQEVCGPGNTPDLLIETSPITGTINGVVEYMWMRKTGDPMDTPINNWTPVPNSNTVNYQPGPVSETTYFARCVRIDDCPFIESNFIEVQVGDDAVADVQGPVLVCSGEALTYEAVGVAPSASVQWSFNANNPQILSQTANSITVSWASFGQSVVNLSVTDNNCTATDQLVVNVSANPNNCANDFDSGGNSSRALVNVETAAYGQAYLSTVYPNPTAVGSPVVLELLGGYDSTQPIYLEAYDATGRRLSQRQLQDGTMRIQLDIFQQQAPGLYLLRLQQGEHTETHRLILK